MNETVFLVVGGISLYLLKEEDNKNMQDYDKVEDIEVGMIERRKVLGVEEKMVDNSSFSSNDSYPLYGHQPDRTLILQYITCFLCIRNGYDSFRGYLRQE